MQSKVEINSRIFQIMESGQATLRISKSNGRQIPIDESKAIENISFAFSSEDALIISEIKNNNFDSFEVFYNKYYSSLYLYARKFITDEEIVKDILQDTFSYIWEKRVKIRINKSLTTYLYRSVHNNCINCIKKIKRKEKYISDFKLKNNSFLNTGFNNETGHSLLIGSELKNEINKTIETLAPQCKRIFLLSRVKGLKHKEIAALLSVSPKTVEVQIFRALKVLRKKLKNY
jgi:RNA polymerase sigma-70 factor (ECF subfamily)